MSARVIDLNERRYRDFQWSPDPSPRDGAEDGERQLHFSQRCAMNAIESLARVFAGQPLHPRCYAVKGENGEWKGVWEPQ